MVHQALGQVRIHLNQSRDQTQDLQLTRREAIQVQIHSKMIHPAQTQYRIDPK